MQPARTGGTEALVSRVLALPGEEKKFLESADDLCDALGTVSGCVIQSFGVFGLKLSSATRTFR
jgi:hypothetical protein